MSVRVFFASSERPSCEECLHEVVPCGYVDSADDAACCGVTLPRINMDRHRDVCQFQRGRAGFNYTSR